MTDATRFLLMASEFPDYPQATLPEIPEGWDDASWGAEPAPHFTTPTGWAVWIDYADDDAREFRAADLGGTAAPRFAVFPIDPDGAHLTTEPALFCDDWSAVVALTANPPEAGA